MSDRNYISVIRMQKPKRNEYLVDCKHCCMSHYPLRSKPDAFLPYTWARQMKGMLAERCERSCRSKGLYHLHKDETIFYERDRENQDI